MTDATVYFIVATCIQTVVLFFVLFANVRRRLLPICPLLTHPLSAYDQYIPTCVRTLLSDLPSTSLTPGIW